MTDYVRIGNVLVPSLLLEQLDPDGSEVGTPGVAQGRLFVTSDLTLVIKGDDGNLYPVGGEAGPAIDYGETADIVTQAYEDAADAGALDEVARADHRHGMPAEGGGGGGGQEVGPYATEMLATSGLVGYWRGYDHHDLVGDYGGAVGGPGYNGGAGAGPSLLPDEPASRSFIFVGPNTYFFAAHNGSGLDVGDVFTLMAVIRPASVSSTPAIMAKGSGSFLLRQNGTNLNLLRSQVADIATSTGVTLAINTTYHVAATKNGSTIKLYINGVDRTGSTSNQTFTNTTSQFYIGANTGGIDGYTGKIAEVAVFNRALSAGEISDLFDLTGL